MLRDYQVEAVQRGVQFLNAPPSSSKPANAGVIVAPTAAGKSHIIAAIAKEVGKVVVIQHSKELLKQNFAKYIADGCKASVYSAGLGSRDIGHVTFATIGSIKEKGELFKGCKVLIDECHLFPPAESSMLGKFMKAAGVSKIVGLTATPFRLMNDELKFLTRVRGKMFGNIIHCIQVQEMTSRGYWSKMMYKVIRFEDRALRLNTKGTDYTEASLKAAYEQNGIEDTAIHIVEKMQNTGGNIIPRKSILVFVPTVAEAISMAKRIPGAEAVWGDMDTKARDRCIGGFKDGSIPVVVNVNVLSVGFDHPGVDGIIVCRPTLSLAWYYQAVGRGTRIDPIGGKKDCWVYDMAGTFIRFGRIENLSIENVPGFGWGVFGTEQKRLFTNIPMHTNVLFTKNNLSHLALYKEALRLGKPWPTTSKSA